MYEEFKKIFDRFSFHETAGTEENDNKDEAAQNAALSKKSDSDSEEEEQDNQQKEKGVSNKKKKLQRRMKIAELRQICLRPDVVEKDWDLVKQMGENYPSVIPCFGLHPWYVAERTPSWFNTLKECLECTPSAAVGEIGLDKGSRGKEIDFTDQVLLSQFLVAQ